MGVSVFIIKFCVGSVHLDLCVCGGNCMWSLSWIDCVSYAEAYQKWIYEYLDGEALIGPDWSEIK